MAETASTDRELGIGMLFGVLCVVGALVMYAAALAHDQVVAGSGFAVAMVAATLAVVAIHAY